MLAIFFIIIGIIARLLPHPPNIAPIAAMALFGGVYLDRRLALLVPLLAMFISDLFLGFHTVIPYVYGSFMATSILGMIVRKFGRFKEYSRNRRYSLVIGASLAGSLIFYLVTNFGVWLETSLYPKTWAGLVESYIMALPFLRNSLIGNLFYTTVFFGGYEMVKLKLKSEKLKILETFSFLVFFPQG